MEFLAENDYFTLINYVSFTGKNIEFSGENDYFILKNDVSFIRKKICRILEFI